MVARKAIIGTLIIDVIKATARVRHDIRRYAAHREQREVDRGIAPAS